MLHRTCPSRKTPVHSTTSSAPACSWGRNDRAPAVSAAVGAARRGVSLAARAGASRADRTTVPPRVEHAVEARRAHAIAEDWRWCDASRWTCLRLSQCIDRRSVCPSIPPLISEAVGFSSLHLRLLGVQSLSLGLPCALVSASPSVHRDASIATGASCTPACPSQRCSMLAGGSLCGSDEALCHGRQIRMRCTLLRAVLPEWQVTYRQHQGRLRELDVKQATIA
jgi:hypothetical protein